MNARWVVAAALAAAGLMVVLGVLTARDEAAPDSVADMRLSSSPADERESDHPIAGTDAARRTALPVPPATDVRAELTQANAEASAGDEHDSVALALEGRTIDAPQRVSRPDAIGGLVSRLGFQSGSRDGDDLSRWLEESARADREALADAANVRDSRQALATSFNTHADERRRALIERFGLPAAEETARRFPIHRLDPQSGALVRVDPHGQPLTLTGED